MIYILEDRPERQKQYIKNNKLFNKPYIKNDATYIHKKDVDREDVLSSKFKDAKLVCIHRSFFNDEKEKIDLGKLAAFKNSMINFKIPTAYFSGGIGQAYVFENGEIANINSKVFYQNFEQVFLPDIESQLAKNVDFIVDLNYLSFGKNYKVNVILRYITAIESILFHLKDDEELSEDVIEKIENYTDNMLTDDFNDKKELIINYLENKTDKKKSIQVSRIKEMNKRLLNLTITEK